MSAYASRCRHSYITNIFNLGKREMDCRMCLFCNLWRLHWVYHSVNYWRVRRSAIKNISGNMLRTKIYVCPICGNVMFCAGEAVISCCGVELPPCDSEEADETHRVKLEPVEDETFVTFDHPMTKSHYISFVAFLTTGGMQLTKLYPEGNAETRLRLRGRGILYWYCNHHGLMKQRI